MSFKFLIDEDQIKKVASVICQQRKGFLSHTKPPVQLRPRGVDFGTLTYALFITYTCQMDFHLLVESENLWEASKSIFELYGEELLPERIIMNPARTGEIIIKHIKGISGQLVNLPKRIIKMAQFLDDFANGDPRSLFEVFKSKTASQDPLHFYHWLLLQSYFRRMPGGRKVLSLWFRMMCQTDQGDVGEGVWRFPRDKLFRIPLAVDKNVVAAGIALGLIELKEGSYDDPVSDPRIQDAFEDLWAKVAKGANFLSMEIDEPIWDIGGSCRIYTCPQDCLFLSLCPKRFETFKFTKDRLHWTRG